MNVEVLLSKQTLLTNREDNFVGSLVRWLVGWFVGWFIVVVFGFPLNFAFLRESPWHVDDDDDDNDDDYDDDHDDDDDNDGDDVWLVGLLVPVKPKSLNFLGTAKRPSPLLDTLHHGFNASNRNGA
uniref:Uncharacterized protein n=1 Tax=Glossina brevipalpis TaxID=37001 RepID=A0A1A9W3A9_9MUSC